MAESKESSRKRQLFGLPALRPHMYQENVLRAAVAGESVGGGEEGLGPELFAAAYDPFANAAVLGKEVERQKQRQGITNLYLSPLGTKAQVLGFDVYFLTELRESAASMIFPFREGYESETGVGISRTWRYRVEFAAMTA